MTGGHGPTDWNPLDGPAAVPAVPSPTLWQNRRGAWLAQAVALIVLSLGLWAGCLKLYAINNRFPADYHPDERTKAEQLITGRRNFNHPQLMLEAALLILPQPLPDDADRVTQDARVVSAAMAAGAAVLLAWAGFAAAGWAGFLCVGLTIGLCPALLSHAHYLKEDATLVFGVAAVLCCGAWLMRVRTVGPQLWLVIALGVACGLAASGKYVGAVMLGPAVLVSLLAPLARRNAWLAPAGPLIVIVFAAAVWAGVNWRVFDDFAGFLDGFGREQEHGTTGHNGLTMDKPNAYFADLVWREAMWHVRLLAVAALPAAAALCVRGRRYGVGLAFGAWLALTTATYLVMLGYGAIPFYRYAVPATVMAYALAALGLAFCVGLLPDPKRRAVALAIGLTTIVALQGWRCYDYTRQFADDSRDALRAWAWTQVPAGTVVAADVYAAVGHANPGDPGPIRARLNVAQELAPGWSWSGTVDALRRSGVKYMICVGTVAERYDSSYVHPEPGFERGARTIAFYRDLKRYPVVWSRVAAHPMWTFTNPDIRVYDISTAK